MKIFTLKLLKLHINQQSAPSVLCDLLKDFPYQVVVLKNSNILHFKLLKRSPSGVATWRGDTAVANWSLLVIVVNHNISYFRLCRPVHDHQTTWRNDTVRLIWVQSWWRTMAGTDPVRQRCSRFAPTCVQYKLHQVILDQTCLDPKLSISWYFFWPGDICGKCICRLPRL